MALPGITIQIQNGALGQTPATDDGVAGLILQGPAPSGLAVGTPAQLTSLADAEALGITASYDTTGTVRVWKHINDFYAEAGTGAVLWIMIISQATSLETMLNVATSTGAIVLLNAAQGKIRLLGATRSPAGGYSPDTAANQVDADCINAINNAQTLATQYANTFRPLRVIIEGRSYTGNSATLTDLKTRDDNRVALMIGDSVSGAGSAIGLLLGRLAKDPVQRNPGRVKSGALSINTAFLGTAAFAAEEAEVPTLHDKGWITFRKYVGKAGYFFTDDPTATLATDDYNSIARGRVIDKAIVLAYSTYVEEILDEIEIDAQGRIALDKAKYYQSIIERTINTQMTANDEISAVSAYVDPEQNVLSTGQLCFELRLRPVGYAKTIVVKLGFDNPAIA